MQTFYGLAQIPEPIMNHLSGICEQQPYARKIMHGMMLSKEVSTKVGKNNRIQPLTVIKGVTSLPSEAL
ncbi:MAG: hypothetical protein ACK55Z_28840 [bacterium]